MITVAFSNYCGRISPVFDFAGCALLVQIDGNAIVNRREVAQPRTNPLERAQRLLQEGAQVLVCGAISRTLENLLTASGVQVISFVCGPEEDVIAAYLDNRLSEPKYQMPGCCRRYGRRMQARARGGDSHARG